MPELETIADELRRITQVVTYLRRSSTEIYHTRNLTRNETFKQGLMNAKTSLLSLKTKMSGIPAEASAPSIAKIDDLVLALDDMHRDLDSMPLKTIQTEFDLIQRIYSTIRGIVPLTLLAIQLDLPTILPLIHRTIRSEVRRDFEEVMKCYSVQAYRGCVAFCGRIAEIVLRRKYYERKRRQRVPASAIDADLDRLTLGQVIRMCREAGMMTNIQGLDEYSSLVNRLRVPSVHATIPSYDPGPDATRGAIDFTLALIRAVC